VIRALLRTSFVLALFLGGASTALTVALSTELSQTFFHSRAYTSTIQLLGLLIGLSTAFSVLQSVLIGLQRFVVYATVSTLCYVTTYDSAVAFLSVRPGINSILYGWALGYGLACVLCIIAILRHARAVNIESSFTLAPGVGPALFRSLSLDSLPLLVSAVFTTGAQFVDRLVLASVANLSSVGVYNYALLLASGSLFVVAPFSTFLIPKISELFGRADARGIRQLSTTSATMIVLVYVPAGLGVASIGPFLLRVVAGPNFVVASLPLAILV
jgi:O-antigen/teichoic acid export membrane protein